MDNFLALGLTPAPPAAGQSDIDAYTHAFGGTVYLSVDPPTAVALGVSPAAVLLGSLAGISVYASAGTLGLGSGDDIDALCVRDGGTRGVFEPGLGDRIVYSLASGSPSGGPDTLFLVTTGAPVSWAASSIFGLGAGGDNLNACTCFDPDEWPGPPPAAGPLINEFVANHSGTDQFEYVEILGDPLTDLSHLTIVEIEGDGIANTGLVDDFVYPVGVTDANGVWWTGFNTQMLENRTMTLLLVEGFFGTTGDDTDTNDDGVIDNPRWTTIVDSVSVFDGEPGDLTYSPTVLDNTLPPAGFTPGGASLIPNGIGPWARNDFGGSGLPGLVGLVEQDEALNTPGAPNISNRCEVPSITQQPTSQAVFEGASVAFSVSAGGTSLSYQWQKDGSPLTDGGNISGATTAMLTINPTFSPDAGQYDVVVENACGSSTSVPATLTVVSCDPVQIDTHPSSQSVCNGAVVGFSVTVLGSDPFTYRWRKNGVDLTDGGNVSGATTTALTINPAVPGDAGDYDVVVTNDCGSVTSDAATLTVELGPTITNDPDDQTVCEDDAVTFTVAAGGTGLTYQWRKDSVNIGGATGSSYTINSVTTGDAGDYDVIVTNPCGQMISDAATLTVLLPPCAFDFDLSRSTIDGGGVMFSAGGSFELSSSIGQTDAGVLTGGAFQLTGGFWFEQPAGDCDATGIVDLTDYEDFTGCLLGPDTPFASPDCDCFDFDDDNDADLQDFSVFADAF